MFLNSSKISVGSTELFQNLCRADFSEFLPGPSRCGACVTEWSPAFAVSQFLRGPMRESLTPCLRAMLSTSSSGIRFRLQSLGRASGARCMRERERESVCVRERESMRESFHITR